MHACAGCGCLVVDQAVHEPVCRGEAAPAAGGEPLGAQVIAWLDSLNPEQVEADALAAMGFDTNGTVAVLDHLKKLAADL